MNTKDVTDHLDFNCANSKYLDVCAKRSERRRNQTEEQVHCSSLGLNHVSKRWTAKVFFPSFSTIFFVQGNKTNSTTSQRNSTGRFAALISSSSENTDQDDFLPSTQHRLSQLSTKSIKRKQPSSVTYAKPAEKKRTKKSNLFQEVVSASSLIAQPTPASPPPPWLDLPLGIVHCAVRIKKRDTWFV